MKQNPKFKLYHQAVLCLLSIITFISASQVSAQEEGQYFISPRLQLGLHTEASLESPIKKLIASGMAVEVIKTEKEFSLIKISDGTEGWIKARFLTQDEPSRLTVDKLEKALQDALNNNSISDSAAASQAPVTDTASEAQLSDEERAAYEETVSALQEELKAWEQLDAQDKQAQKIQAEKSNQQLQKRLSMIASLAMGEEVASNQFDVSTLIELPTIIDSSDTNIFKLFKKNYLILAMVSGLSFLFGIFVMDAFNRRRHGGYRV
ncbi:MAG: TIGR04211 family SH3 domain-containing protein [Gammaproteobacteria bacterium]|jgi:SH3 domain protein|nr:TIGR04211 family SH3 domain-containing protein [Gammaproteobacteria bacterium]